MPQRNPSNTAIILEELRILQSEMKENNQVLRGVSVTLSSVEKQTIKTNGRVSELEERVALHRGGLYVAYALIGIALSIFAILR